MSIYDFLRRYNAIRFHTPGHKGELNRFDITELEDEFPLSIVSDAEKATAKIYGASNLKFLVNGSSIGMKASIMSCGGDILSECYRHKCVDEGGALARKKVYTIASTLTTGGNGLPALPTAQAIKASLDAHPSVGIVVVQYPDYYGRCADIDAIYKYTQAAGLKLIVDSAHGAHFAFSPLLPKSAVLASDACNLSAHKTLNAYTQTAYLAYSDELAGKVEHNLELLGTTSPNYVYLAQLEKAATDAHEQDYQRLYDITRDLYTLPTLKNDDFTRFVFDCRNYGGGRAVYRKLRDENIAAEKVDDNYVVFIFTPADTAENLKILYEELKLITEYAL